MRSSPYLVHVAGFNLSLVMRQILGVGTPRGLQGRLEAILQALGRLVALVRRLLRIGHDGRAVFRGPVPMRAAA